MCNKLLYIIFRLLLPCLACCRPFFIDYPQQFPDLKYEI